MSTRFAAISISSCVAAALLATSISAQHAVVRTADPIKRGMKESDFPRTVKVTDNVYTYEDFHAGDEKFTTTNMFVVTRDGVLLADAQGNGPMTKGLVDAIAKITPQPIKYVVIASDHGDHTAGNAMLPADVKYIIHPTSKAILDRQAAAPNARPDTWKLPADAELVPDKKTITMGGETFQILFLGRAHTGGDLAVYLPKEKILFLSEIFLNRVFPAMRSAYPTEWLGALNKAEKMDVTTYIAGHGFTEDSAVSKEEIRTYHKAMEAVIAEATRLHKAGVPVEDAVKQANFGEYATWTLAKSQGPIAIRKVYDELDGKLK
jgi:glyoxylase-like metal-dependent hydrolase (beta-lactamase superfamily II)